MTGGRLFIYFLWLFLLSATVGAASANSAEPTWAVDPGSPGKDLPPVGRSLFDHLMTSKQGGKSVYELPFPFSKLIEKLRAKLPPPPKQAPDADYDEVYPFIGITPLQSAIIPLGRSLQRSAGKPDFYKYPRVVVAVDAYPLQSQTADAPNSLGMSVRNRVFVGFHEKAAALEVISYNELAGRFEFQVIHNYKKGQTPKIYYASRTLCLQCHQGQAPIFSKPAWDETNANAAVFKRLLTDLPSTATEFPDIPDRLVTKRVKMAEGRVENVLFYYGIPLLNNNDAAYAIDNAANAANDYLPLQKLWSDACDVPGGDAGKYLAPAKCRAQALKFILQAALNGKNSFDTRSGAYQGPFLSTMQAAWNSRWPGGLKLAEHHIENRNPLDPPLDEIRRANVSPSVDSRDRKILDDLIKSSDIPVEYEPLTPRQPAPEPQGIWKLYEKDLSQLNHIVTGFNEQFTPTDGKILDDRLFQLGTKATTRRYAVSCVAQVKKSPMKVKLTCSDPKDFEPETDGAGTAKIAGLVYVRDGNKVLRENLSSLSMVVFRDRGETCQMALPPNTSEDATQLRLCAKILDLEVSGSLSTQDGTNTLTLLPYSKFKQLHARLPDGDAVRAIHIEWKGDDEGNIPATGYIEIQNDFDILAKAIDETEPIVTTPPFRRGAILKALYPKLGLPEPIVEGEDSSFVPGDPELEPERSTSGGTGGKHEKEAVLFRNGCAKCHKGAELPAPFAAGNDQEVEDNITHCAERIYFRLKMWEMQQGARPKSPMPPQSHVDSLKLKPEEWESLRASLVGGIETILQEKNGGHKPDLQGMIRNGFGSLPACLPPKAGGQP